jgi:hypothetical protein
MEIGKMRRLLVGMLFVVTIGFMIRYSLVLYYTFCKIDPWGVERYLSMRGVKDARIDWNWRLNFSRCRDPSGLIGEFPVFTSICGRCDEFDVSNVVKCVNLVNLDVAPSGLLRNLDALNGRREIQVSGTVDRPIVDTSLLNTIQNSNWRITLRPTSNSFHDTCNCLSPEVYIEIVVDADVFSQATRDEMDSLRRQSFLDINGCRSDCFWEMFDGGFFNDVLKGKIPVSSLIRMEDK